MSACEHGASRDEPAPHPTMNPAHSPAAATVAHSHVPPGRHAPLVPPHLHVSFGSSVLVQGVGTRLALAAAGAALLWITIGWALS
ncbi:hypothetical protein ebA1811 [Aromatoleum aromaticum EbN1]|uniref:Uncharacterized protein n=1 Tax=Aromatoleum aromaticum (strain DSM 19018 / LMG 30748 / EbN1) TaxID=76114 RepID=Q5P6F8_AROAE|nr:hypothetical protein ebA1811 [Aromatoleum aromaticum EbN1]